MLLVGVGCTPAGEIEGNADPNDLAAQRVGTGSVDGGRGAGDAATAVGSKTADAGPRGGRGCSAAGLLFCDDFERDTTVGMPPPSPRWSIARIGQGTVAVDGTTPAHSGARSVKVDSAGGYQTFFALSGAPVFPAAGPLYLRVYLRLGAPMTGGHNTYFKSGAAGATSSEHETRIGVMNEMLMINQPAGDRGFLSNQNFWNDRKLGTVFAAKTWTCVEVFLDPPHSTIDVRVDGKEVPDLHRTDWKQDPIGVLHFGFEKYAGPDADIWYDDIAVGTKPIGCD